MRVFILSFCIVLLTGCGTCKPDIIPPVILKPPAPPVRLRPDLRIKKIGIVEEAQKVKALVMDLEDVIGYSELLENDLSAYR